MYSDSGDCPQTSAVFVTAFYYGSAEEFGQSCVDAVNFHLYLCPKKRVTLYMQLFCLFHKHGVIRFQNVLHCAEVIC